MNLTIPDVQTQLAAFSALLDAAVVLDKHRNIVGALGRFGPEFAKFIASEYCPIKDLVDGCFRGEDFEGVWNGIRIGGSRESTPWHIRGVPIFDKRDQIEQIAISLVMRGHRAEPAQSLQRELHEYESIFLRMKQGVWRVDEYGKIVNVNPYLATWLETETANMIGRDCTDFLHEIAPSIDVQQSSISERFEARFNTAHGVARRAIVVRTRLRQPGGEPNGWLDVITDITTEHAVQDRLMREVQRMAQLASFDSLTGLANRRTFDILFNEHLENVESNPFGLLVLDVDGLKEINDSLGHEAGDLVLSEFAKRLKGSLRASDHVARFGGDEFACIVTNVTQAEFSETVVRCEEACTFSVNFKGDHLPVRVSIGCVHSEQDNREMLATADRRMYHRKLLRKNPS